MRSHLRLLMSTAMLCPLICPPTSAQVKDTQTQDSSTSKTIAQEREQDWQLAITPYLWFAGAHGTVGALGRNVSMHGSPGDLLSHADVGLVGAAEARYRRFLLTGDLLWIRLSDGHAVPFPGVGATSADVRVGQFMWTSKIGYRLVDHKKLKADANLGARYWHLGRTLTFNPSLAGVNFNGSQSWGDIVVGGHVQLPLGKKITIDALGDVGGWDATAKLDYQFAALLGYKLGPRVTLVAGYRYLFVDYRPSTLSVFSVVTSGALIGATFSFK